MKKDACSNLKHILRFLYDKRGAAGIPVVASGCVKRHLEKARTAKSIRSGLQGPPPTNTRPATDGLVETCSGSRNHKEQGALFKIPIKKMHTANPKECRRHPASGGSASCIKALTSNSSSTPTMYCGCSAQRLAFFKRCLPHFVFPPRQRRGCSRKQLPEAMSKGILQRYIQQSGFVSGKF